MTSNCFGCPSNCNKAMKEIKTGGLKITLSLFEEGMIVYAVYPKDLGKTIGMSQGDIGTRG